MDWTTAGDLIFMLGGYCSLALLVYGGWLCIPQTEDESGELALGGRKGAAMREAKHIAARQFRLGAIAILAVSGLFASPRPALAEDQLQRGLEAYRESKYLDAIGQFRLAADEGNGRAQEILGFMYLRGQSAFGPMVSQDRVEATYWFGRAAREGREVAQHMLCVLSGSPASTAVDRGSCVATAVAAPTGQAGCNAQDPDASRAYLVLDQSARSDPFRAALKTLVRPGLVAVNTMKGDHSRAGTNAEQHPLAYVFTNAGPALQFDDPAEFARVVNALTPCPRS